MRKILLTIVLVGCTIVSHAGSKVIYTADIIRDVEKTSESPAIMRVSTNAIVDAFKLSSAEAFELALSEGKVQFLAKQGSTSKTYNTPSYGNHGYWFTKSGIGCAANNANRRMACKYEKGFFHIIHNNATDSKGNALVNTGDSYTFVEMFVFGGDTVQYVFNVIIGSDERIEDDQPEYVETIEHRTDEVDTWPLQPLVRQNDGEWLNQNYIQVMAGDKISFSCSDKDGNTTFLVGYKSGKTQQSLRGNQKNPEFVLTEGATTEDAGYYICNMMYKNSEGVLKNMTGRIYVDVQTQPLGTPFSWEGVVPKFSHDWKSDPDYNYGVYTKPTKNRNDVSSTDRYGKPTHWVNGEWWTCCWGSNLNKTAGDPDSEEVRKAAENMMKKYDEDFGYIRDQMGWPPDLRARSGYRSLVYIFGSGLQEDSTPNTEEGGYQGTIGGWPCVWVSYYPFSRFRDDADKKWSDGDYQREAMIHEGIHAIFADLNHCQRSSWFHEAGNTWLQSAMNTERYNKYGTPGFLDGCPFIAPFQPIECYSGWLLDGSFGGPQAEGVNLYDADGQVCTWRNYLGGTQYGNSFPIILSEICGKGSIPWIWRNCTDYVLKGIGEYLGDETMRQLILQYRARQATFDIGGWKEGYRAVMNGNIGLAVKEEYGNGVMTKADKSSATMPCSQHIEPFRLTPYQGLKRNSIDGWMAPDEMTNPGWSGANIIPIHVDSKENRATIEFLPQNTEMRAQLCYVTKAGKCYYSQPIHCGKTQIDLTDRPANNVVFLVVCNTDYVYTGEEQRKTHWDYRVRLLDGALQVADLYTKWSLNEQILNDASFDEDAARAEKSIYTHIDEIIPNAPSAYTYVPGENGVHLLTGNCIAGQPIQVQLAEDISPEDVRINMLGLSGIVVDNAFLHGNSYTLPANLVSGLYFIKFTHHGKVDTYKVFVQ